MCDTILRKYGCLVSRRTVFWRLSWQLGVDYLYTSIDLIPRQVLLRLSIVVTKLIIGMLWRLQYNCSKKATCVQKIKAQLSQKFSEKHSRRNKAPPLWVLRNSFNKYTGNAWFHGELFSDDFRDGLALTTYTQVSL